MKSNSVVIEKQPIFVSCRKLKVPESNISCLHKSTKINICHPENTPTNPGICYINNKECSVVETSCVNKDFSHLSRRSVKTNILPQEPVKYSSFFKGLAVLLLMCDIFYLHVNIKNVEATLQNSLKIIEDLESQLKFSKMSYEMFKADENYLMYLNRMLTKDINSKVELLIKLNKLFVDHADSSLNSIIDILRNQKSNDDEIIRIVKKRNMSNNITEYSNRIISNDEITDGDFQQDYVHKNNEFETFLSGSNDSLLFQNSNYEKNGVDRIIGLRNVTAGSLSVSSGVSRVKRQTVNNSRSNNRGPLLIHFRGAQPEALIQDGGVIAPWFGELDVSGDYLYRNYILREGKAKVEVTEKGLYLIYAQVYYLTSNPLNSFSINVQGEKENTERVIALCSTEAAVQGLSEVSCYTSVVRQLYPGDKIFLIQRERYRRVLFREGHTFLGIVALNSPPKC